MAQAAGEVKIILAVDGASYSAALEKAKTQLKQLEHSVGEAGKATRAEMKEATASIGLFGEEFGVHLPRHVRTFVAQLPGVASAMSAAFSGAAVLAIGMAIFETGKKVYEFIEKTEEAAKKNAEAWRAIQTPIEAANDELAVTNDKLETAIAKLEHKPVNGMKQAIDEAILSADKLGEKLDADQQKIVATLKTQETGVTAQIFGRAGTGDVTGRGTALQEALDEINIEGRERLKALRGQNATQDQIDAATKELNGKRKEAIDKELKWATGELTTAKKLEALPRPTSLGGTRGIQGPPVALQAGRIQELAGYAAALGGMSDFVEATQKNIALAGQLPGLQAGADNLAALKAANAKQMEEWKRHLAEVEALTDLSKQDEANYWRGLADAIHANAPLAQSAMEEANRAQIAANKEYRDNLMKGWRDDAAAFERKRADDDRIHNEVMAAYDANQTDIAKGIAEQRQGARDNFSAAAEEINAAMREGEESIRGTRGLSQMDAARALQELHAAGAAAWLQAFGTAQNAGAGFTLTDAERHGAVVTKQNEIDDAAMKSATALGSLENAAAELAVRFTDMPAAIGNAVSGIIGTTNDALLSTLTDRQNRGQWRDAGRRIFTGVTATGLQMAEGALMKAIPGVAGKLGSGFTNPLYTLTRIVGGATPAGAGVSGIAASTAAGVASGAGGALAKIGGMILSALPWAAEGGPIATGIPTIVGEAGPELFVPSGAGRIVPSGGFGGTTHVWNIDARGANDPAAVRFAVQRGILEAAPRIAAGSIAASRDIASRRPTMAR